MYSIQGLKDNPNLFVSASKDGTARIWSLETFTHLYTFEFESQINFVTILEGAQFLTTQNEDKITISKLHYVL